LTGCERLSKPRTGNLSTPSKILPIPFLSGSLQVQVAVVSHCAI
jgi:hypothetical protein